jgi:hypothetical protein
MITVQVVDQAEQTETGDPRRMERCRPATLQTFLQCRQTPLATSEPELGRTQPRVGDAVPRRRLLGTKDRGSAGRLACPEIAEQPGVHGAQAVRGGGT